MKVAIIGAGYTGMSIAKKLIEKDIHVSLYEKDSKVGGMTKNIQVEDIYTDKYYRHLFKSDKYLIELAKEMQIDIKWFKGKMGYYIQNNLYNWGQAISLLAFKPLTFMQKIRFGVSVLKIKFIKNWRKLESYTIEEWFKENKYEDIYNVIWKPLLNNKFGIYDSKVSMAWIWAKICLRKTENSFNKEVLGYIEDFEEMNHKMQEYLTKKGCIFKLCNDVQSIEKIEDKYVINNDFECKYDVVISTISYEQTKNIFKKYLTTEEIEKLSNFRYISADTMIIKSKKKLSSYYWLNVADDSFPFCGIIDYHNMEDIDKKDIIYISNYIDSKNPIYNLTEEELLNKYLPYIKKINKDFSKKDIEFYTVVKEEYAQPIIEPMYSEVILNNKLSENGLYVNTLPQIYPEDRGVNYAIRNGYKLANEIIEKWNLA